MRTRAWPSLLSILVIMVLGSVYLAVGVVRVHWFSERITATMSLPESGGLLPRSKVLLSGVEVGRVTEVTHVPGGVRIGLDIGADHPIPAASPARIESLSGLGEAYLEFQPSSGAGPYLRDGDILRADAVSAPASIPDIARSTTDLVRQLDPTALASIVHTFGQAVAGTETLIPELSRSTNLLAATLLSRTDLIRRMLLAMQANATDMDWAEPALLDASGPWADFGPRVAEVADSIARVIRAGNAPDSFLENTDTALGLSPFLAELTEELDAMGPAMAPYGPLLAPLYALATPIISQLDLGALISQALHATTPDGTLRLQITVE
ncbi:MlaD family protein [Nocardia sp. IFM 10818]